MKGIETPPNGAAVSRVFGDGSGELVAWFQYSEQADAWAKMEVDKLDQTYPSVLVRADLCSGKARVFRAIDAKVKSND